MHGDHNILLDSQYMPPGGRDGATGLAGAMRWRRWGPYQDAALLDSSAAFLCLLARQLGRDTGATGPSSRGQSIFFLPFLKPGFSSSVFQLVDIPLT